MRISIIKRIRVSRWIDSTNMIQIALPTKSIKNCTNKVDFLGFRKIIKNMLKVNIPELEALKN